MKKILNEHTGQIYSTLVEAAQSCGGDPSNIRRCCMKQQKSHKGYEWNYIEDTEMPKVSSEEASIVRLVISDTQAPFHHPDTFPFLRWVCEEFGVTHVTHIGDEVDNSHASLFARNPDAISFNDEIQRSQEFMDEMYENFEEMTICNSNHGDRPFRNSGMHPRFIKSPGEVFNAPKTYRWADQWIHEGVLYHHGHFSGHGNINPAIRFAVEQGRSVAIGHRPCCNIHFQSSKHTSRTLFGMSVGALINRRDVHLQYGKYSKDIPLAVGIVIDGRIPFLVHMPTNPVNDRWDYSKTIF